MGGYVSLEELFVYTLSVELEQLGWSMYQVFDWQTKKIMGDQFIEAVDSVGANIAEGYGRYYYLDRIKFYYNARGSLLETKHWANRLVERNKITQEQYDAFIQKASHVHLELNKYIQTCYQSKKQ